MNRKKITYKTQEIIDRIKGFNFTKYLLCRKEIKFLNKIEDSKELIEHWNEQMVIDKAHITACECEIAILTKSIKELEVDVKKVIKVINLYIK